LWAGHAPALAAHSGGGWPTAPAWLDELLPDFEELLPQPARATVTARAPRTASASLPRRPVRILFANDIFVYSLLEIWSARKRSRRTPEASTRQAPVRAPNRPESRTTCYPPGSSSRPCRWVSAYWLPSSTGNSTSSDVPAPGGLSSEILPPIASARSFRPSSPDPSAGSAPPRPSSRTATRRIPSRASTATCTPDAQACFATFASASETT